MSSHLFKGPIGEEIEISGKPLTIFFADPVVPATQYAKTRCRRDPL